MAAKRVGVKEEQPIIVCAKVPTPKEDPTNGSVTYFCGGPNNNSVRDGTFSWSQRCLFVDDQVRRWGIHAVIERPCSITVLQHNSPRR